MKLTTTLGAALLVVAAPLVAQSVGRTYSRSYGNSYLGGSISATARASYSGNVSYANASAYLDGRLYGRVLTKSVQFGRGYVGVSGNSRSGRLSGSARAFVQIAGRTLYSRSYSASYRRSWTFSTRPANYKLFPVDPTFRFTLGPVPIKVKGNAGASARASVTASVASSLVNMAGLRGSAQAWAWGKGSVSAGISVAGIGLDLNGKFANNTLSASAYVGTRGPRGRVTYTLQAISLKLSVWVKVLFKKFSKTLVTYGSSPYSRTLWSR